MSEKIRNMFAEISGKYDLMNNTLSFGIHHRWRKKLVKIAGISKGMDVLDCATGTGDLAFEMQKSVGSNGKVTATDFCQPMLDQLELRKGSEVFNIQQADVMDLQFQNNSFDIATISFGIRNVDNPQQGVSELARVVKPGGKVVILEFGTPDKHFYYFYKFYSSKIIPTLGKLISGSDYAYQYLHDSASKFPFGDSFKDIMLATDMFNKVEFHKLTFGVVYLYVGYVKNETK